MPNIKSAKKRMKQNTVSRLRNRSRMSQMRTEVKKFRVLVEEKQFDEARSLLSRVYRVIDKTARKGTIHSNTAARYKSRLSHFLQREAAASN